MLEKCRGCDRLLAEGVIWTENNHLKPILRLLCNECRKSATSNWPLFESKSALFKKIKALEMQLYRLKKKEEDREKALNKAKSILNPQAKIVQLEDEVGLLYRTKEQLECKIEELEDQINGR